MSKNGERYHHAIELIGRRWTGVILRSLLSGAARFGELRATVPNLSDRLLSTRLKEFEAEGLVDRRQVTHRHIEYELTQKGLALAPVIQATERWADQWL